jgi:hypothetical protein
MATFTITYKQSMGESVKTEDVEADDYIDEGDSITFRKLPDTGRAHVEQILRVRARHVSRIDRKP